MTPTVSFVVPCYKLAHLLSECLDSILGQTFQDFEILIMDDCSPDHTGAVAQSYADPRVRYLRNETNLRHLQNYNKGISLARGKYVWLISADDTLRRPYVLQRYVDLMERHPKVGYVFCSAVGLSNGRETGVLDYSYYGERDAIIPGRRFLPKLVEANTIVAASGMVRKECYDKLGMFPLDMPWGGDWYLWCAFALHFDVAYMAEPMVCYRRHDGSMTNELMQVNIDACYSDDIKIPWMIKAMVDQSGRASLSRACLRAIAKEYAHSMTGKQYKAAKLSSTMTAEQFEHSLGQYTKSARESAWVRARVYSGMADRYYERGEFAKAREFYYRGLHEHALMPQVLAKWLLVSCGRWGIQLRSRTARVRRTFDRVEAQ